MIKTRARPRACVDFGRKLPHYNNQPTMMHRCKHTFTFNRNSNLLAALLRSLSTQCRYPLSPTHSANSRTGTHRYGVSSCLPLPHNTHYKVKNRYKHIDTEFIFKCLSVVFVSKSTEEEKKLFLWFVFVVMRDRLYRLICGWQFELDFFKIHYMQQLTERICIQK